jgi:hypothetical protein
VQTVLQTFTVACVCVAFAVAASGHSPAVLRRVQADYLPVIKAKQRTAFPPNYIHSLDSAHMMLTAIACSKAGECSAPAGVRSFADSIPCRRHLCRGARLVLDTCRKVRG